jgi:cytochrome c
MIKMQSKTIRFLVGASGAMLLAAVAFSDTKADAVAGRASFEKRCTGCHALDRDRVGPRLAGVVGRKAGSVSGFPYSDAVKKSAVVWNETMVGKWLSDPEAVIPDTDMTFRLDNPVERAAIIAFLKGTGK